MILEKIDSPRDLKLLKKDILPALAKEIREKIVQTVSTTGGHLAPSLGCVELAIALHYVFATPEDKIVWDVGHQTYAHKILTGRKEKFSTLRQFGGLSGFTRREESEYDPFGAGHSSTAISAALGLAVARDLKKEDYKIIAVVGDGSLTGGMAYEALNNVGHLRPDLLVILNDNEMFISHRVGAFAGYLTRILTLGLVRKFEKTVERFLRRLHFLGVYLLRIARRFKVLFFPGMLFEEFGFSYLGPVDGHNLSLLVEILEGLKHFKGPVLLHILTKKGKGYPPAEKKAVKFHGIEPFEISTGEILKKNNFPTYSQVFGETLARLAREDKRICVITAAMETGTGLTEFAQEFPERFFDVGIAEQHAVTFAAGLAAGGMRPFCAIYSTFLQRAIDQIIHDVALQNLPVIFALDRAGIVGEDGPTHQGVFDLSYLRMIPNLIVMAPANGNELQDMLYTAVQLNRPVTIRYPRGETGETNLNKELKILPLGKGEILRPGKDLLILAFGQTIPAALEASEILARDGLETEVINLRFLKPLDEDLIRQEIEKLSGKTIVTIEENVLSGGLGSAVREIFSKGKISIFSLGLPDKFIEQGRPEELRNKYGLTGGKIAQKILEFLSR